MTQEFDDKGYISERIDVPAGWEDVFTHFYYAANHTQQPVHKTLLPTFQTFLLFSFGEPVVAMAEGQRIVADKSIVMGPIRHSLEYILPPGSELLVVNFRFDAFYRFFGASLKAYDEWVRDPDDLIGSHCFADIWSELKAMPGLQQRVQHILAFSGAYLRTREAGSEQISGENLEDNSINPIKVIADKTGQSERNVQLNFKKYLGYSAKEMARYQRFQQAVNYVRERFDQGKTIDWFDVIDHCGYYDQSHLIRDFKFYLDVSPSQFLKLQSSMCVAGAR